MENVSKKVRVRFAPSPTGYMHIGNLRTALYDYLFARKYGGDFVLRIEDTDQKRFVPGAVESLLGVMEMMGLGHDEGPFLEVQNAKRKAESIGIQSSSNYPGIVEVGDRGPYIQSERLDIYKRHARRLVDEGKAYYCFCAPERLEAMRQEQAAAKRMPKYDRHCLGLSAEEVAKNLAEGAAHTVRFRIPDDVERVEFVDLIRGQVSVKTETLQDTVILKSDGYPTYHLAMAVDDSSMGITHVIRGEEWLPSAPLHLLLFRAFGWEAPEFAHLPMILNPDKSKLSKRQGDVAVEDYLKKGYLKEALVNFIALLGWNPGEGSTQEVFSLDELVEKFDFSHVHKAGAVFDIKKLDWLNAQYIKKLSVDELYALSLPFWERKDFYLEAAPECRDEAYAKKILTIEQERLNRLDEVGESNRFFFGEPEYDRDLLRWKQNGDEETLAALMTSSSILESTPEGEWTRENLSAKLMEAAGEKRGDLLWPLRVALTGARQSPSPFEVAWVLGKEESLRRLAKAMEKFA
jgi:nondiscriminating glutamyl-tRNA synthetase